MHDGYVYTLGLTNAVDGPAARLINDALAALPPVKRAAFVPTVSADSATALAAELQDAELLICVAAGGQAAVEEWLTAALSAVTAPLPGLAVLIGCDISSAELHSTAERLSGSGLRILHESLHSGPLDAALRRRLRSAYAEARLRCTPVPLPADWTIEEE
jgi:hypothetical protein